MRFHFHQDVRLVAMKGEYAILVREKSFNRGTFHDRGIVRIRDDSALWRHPLRILDHSKETDVLHFAVNAPGGIEYLVSAMFRVGLCEHHQLYVCGIACDTVEIVEQIVDFVDRQRETHFGIRARQRRPALSGYRNHRKRLWRLRHKEFVCRFQAGTHVFGHGIMNGAHDGITREIAERVGDFHVENGAAFDALDPG